jgi:opacity protein-like surface antigen
MKRILFIVLICLPMFVTATNDPKKIRVDFGDEPEYHPQGTIQVGMRTTLSAFNHDGSAGYGVGGQFRIWLAKKVNTEWFSDYITTDLSGLGKRTDAHIGWSVMFYPFEGTLQNKFTPYIIAGHCFDYTKVVPFNTVTELNTNEFKERWSSATQAGLGVHWNITPKFNLSLSTQYMIHLGNSVHTEVVNNNGSNELNVFEESGASMEGHMLTTLSLNVRLGDLW